MTPSDVCVAYLNAFSTGDIAQISRWVGDDFVNEHTSAMGQSLRGKRRYLERLPGFLAGMPGLAYEIEQTIAEDDHVAVAYILRAVLDGRPIAVRGTMHFVVADGLIVKRTDYWDSMTFRRQAGLD